MFSYRHYEKKCFFYDNYVLSREKWAISTKKQTQVSQITAFVFLSVFLYHHCHPKRSTISASGPSYLYIPVPFTQNRKDFQP